MDASRPIPSPLDDDNEDVYVALSTATALWSRGEREDALRWLRRAAETAADADEDARALDLFKAAAEVAAKLSAPAPDPAAAVTPAPPQSVAARTSAPPPLPTAAPQQGYSQARPSAPPPPPTTKPAPPPLPVRGAQGPGQAVSVTPQVQQPSGRRATRGESRGGQVPAPATTRGAPIGSSVSSAPTGPRPAVPMGGSRPPMPRSRTPEAGVPASQQGMPQAGRESIVSQPPVSRAPMRPPSSERVQAVRYDTPPPVMQSGQDSAMEGRKSYVPMPPSEARGAPPTARAAQAEPAHRGDPRAAASPVAARSSGQPARVRTRSIDRRPPAPDDELTAPRELPDLVSGPDDLDEETAIIQGGSKQEAAIEAILRSQAAESAARQSGAASSAAAAAPREHPEAGVGENTDVPTNVNLNRSPRIVAAAATAEAAPPRAAGHARPTPLPALRVAVVAGPSGEARVVPLAEGDAPPLGSALAILVPLSEGDGSAVARLLGL